MCGVCAPASKSDRRVIIRKIFEITEPNKNVGHVTDDLNRRFELSFRHFDHSHDGGGEGDVHVKIKRSRERCDF